jgi:hypothetical protein
MQALLNNISWSKFKCLLNVTNLKELRRICNGSHSLSGKHTGLSRPYIKKGPGLEYFIYNSAKSSRDTPDATVALEKHPYLDKELYDGCGLKGKYSNYFLS